MPEAPLIYDIGTDDTRPMTQADADRWANYQQAMGQFLRGNDILRLAMRSVAERKMDWRVLNGALNELEKIVKGL